MTTVRIPFFLCCLLLAFRFVSAQYVPAKSEPHYLHDPAFPLSCDEVWTFPYVDVQALLQEDEQDNMKAVPLRFGYPHETDFDLSRMGMHQYKKGKGTLHLFRLHSDSALSINLVFSRFKMVPGAELFVYDPQKKHVQGPFTSFHNTPQAEFGTLPVPGDEIIIEWFEPENQRGHSELVLQRVVHGYRDIFKKAHDFNDSGPCNINVNCSQGAPWQNQKTSVALLMIGGFRFCSGSLVNDVPQDGKPYFLTANHCLDNSVASWVFVFNYESPGCTNVDGSLADAISGCALRAHSAASDFALLELSMPPPAAFGVYHSGWSAQNTAMDSSVVIHHPAGDVKKISFDKDMLTASSGGSGVANAFWNVGNYEWGTTEGGSSGSPLFNKQHRVIGQLYGGSASCTSITYDDYGKFAYSWSSCGNHPSLRLKDWLDPASTGTTFTDGAYLQNTDSNDAGIAWIESPLASQCDSVVTPKVWIRNFGNNTLQSLKVFCVVDAGSPQQLTLSPGIAWYGTFPATFAAQTLSAGLHTVKFYTSQPNGATDPDPTNDTLSLSFSVQTGAQVYVEILPDINGSEISWTLRGPGSVLLGGGQNLLSSTVSSNAFCLQPGSCYDFVIRDAGADGICCANGNGMYRIRNDFGNYAQGGQYGAMDSVHFCVSNVQPQVTIQVPNTRVCQGTAVPFIAQSLNGPVSVQWSFQGGTPSVSTSVSQNVIFSTPGTYTIVLQGTSAIGSDTDTFQITVLPKPQVTVTTTPNFTPGPANGTATANVSAGTPPFIYAWNSGGNTSTLTGLSAGTYIVTVTDSNGCSSQALGTVSTQMATEPELNAELKVFPNPSAGNFEWMWEGCPSGNLSWRITDLNGRELEKGELYSTASAKNCRTRFETRLPAGIYMLTVTDAEKKASVRLLITP